MKTQSNQIIIAGAGPTGLMLANQLTRFEIDHIILDQKSGPTDQSRALVVHARSMEIYEQLGLSSQIVAEGQKNDGMTLYKNGKIAASVTIVNPDENASPFPYLMMYEQSKNENLLYKNLLAQNRSVQWNTCITGIEQVNELYILKAKQGDNDIVYECRYLIACDGSKSLIRDFSKMPFTGGSYLNVFFVADTGVDGGFSSKKVSLFVRKDGMNILFPMKGENHFRVLGILPVEYYHKYNLPFEEILDKVKEGMQTPWVHFYDTNWHSTYRSHHKKIYRFSKGNIFFAGDAAHVHSPVGGQGMNTGLQDAYNLAWKLALVQKGKALPSLLSTYHEERNPVAAKLLQTNDKMFSFMSTNSFWYNLFRLYFLPFFIPLITKSKTVRRQIFHQVSQIQINYTSSSLAKGKAGKIKAGRRLPYCLLTLNNITTSIYTLINEKAISPFTVLLYNVSADGFEQLNTSLFRLLPIEVNNSNNKAFKAVGLPAAFVMIVRPDNYIGYLSEKADANNVSEFFAKAYSLV